MEQLPAVSTVVCITLLIFTWGPGGLSDCQMPRSNTVTAGENMTLNCTSEYKEGMSTGVLWLWGLEAVVALYPNHPFYQGQMSCLDELTQQTVTLTLSKLEKGDAGFYQHCTEIYKDTTETGECIALRVVWRIQTAAGNMTELHSEPHTKLTIYKAVIAVESVGIILLAGALVLCKRKAATTESHLKDQSKRGKRSASDPNENLHYAEITVKAPAQTEYASVRPKEL